jgi:hypothetical protein
LLLIASVAVAGNGSGSGADPFETYNFSGTVAAINSGSGSGMPMITVDDASQGQVDIALGPVWFLQAAGFSAADDDSVEVLAFGCATCAAPYVAAWVVNNTNGTSVDLRDADGKPLWIQRQYQRGGSGRPGQGNGSGGQNGGGSSSGNGQPGGSGNGSGNGPSNGSGLDMSMVESVTGVVVAFEGHGEPEQPVLTLDVGGETVEITVSPYGPIAAAGLIIEPGMTLTVTFAPTECEEDPHLVTIAILDDATGILVQLRDPETGFPMNNGNGHNRPNWP